MIPCSLVLDITKERTARIIPNAVAILSSEGRHVFGSLLSRDSAFETLVRVWRKEIGHDEPDHCGNDKEVGAGLGRGWITVGMARGTRDGVETS